MDTTSLSTLFLDKSFYQEMNFPHHDLTFLSKTFHKNVFLFDGNKWWKNTAAHYIPE